MPLPGRNSQHIARALPLGPVWDEFYRRHNTPAGLDFMTEIARYETAVLSRR